MVNAGRRRCRVAACSLCSLEPLKNNIQNALGLANSASLRYLSYVYRSLCRRVRVRVRGLGRESTHSCTVPSHVSWTRSHAPDPTHAPPQIPLTFIPNSHSCPSAGSTHLRPQISLIHLHRLRSFVFKPSHHPFTNPNDGTGTNQTQWI